MSLESEIREHTAALIANTEALNRNTEVNRQLLARLVGADSTEAVTQDVLARAAVQPRVVGVPALGETVSRQQLIDFARASGFSIQLAVSLWGHLNARGFQSLVADLGVTFRFKNKRLIRSDLPKLVELLQRESAWKHQAHSSWEGPQDPFYGYGPKAHELLIAVAEA